MITARRRGFTLIELLIVVAIISILAAIALPNFIDAQTRSKVSAAKSNIRSGLSALMAYHVDHNTFPPTEPVFPADPLGLLASEQLYELSTPITYIGLNALRDPFGEPRLYSQLQQIPVANPGLMGLDDFMSNDEKSMIYIHFRSTSERFSDPRLASEYVSLISIGPDLEDSLGGFSTIPEVLFAEHFAYIQDSSPYNTLYDPTNGTTSAGDIPGFAGSESWP